MSCSVRLPKLFFFTDTATTEIYTLSLHDALPILGFSVALSPTTLMYCAIGVTVGMFIGVLPGIGPIATVGMLLPITFHLRPTEALIMLAGIYYGAMYGGSITSILLRLPGDASSAVTVVEGYPMAQQGRAGTALVMTTVASFFGACVAIV